MRLSMKEAIAVAEVAPEGTERFPYNKDGYPRNGDKLSVWREDYTYTFDLPDNWQLNTGTPPDCDKAEVIYADGSKHRWVEGENIWLSTILVWRPAEAEKPEPAPRLYTYRGVGDGAIRIADIADHENGYWRPIPDAELVEMLLNIPGLVESLAERLREANHET